MGLCTSKQQDHAAIQIEQLKSCTLDNTDEITYMFTKAKVIKVYDGDSCTVAAHHANQIFKFNVRIFGIDCDEMRGGTEKSRHNAKLAKKFAESMVLGKIVDINVLNNKIVDGKKLKEKFGRLLATISINGRDLGEALYAAGLARKYYGGHKETTPLHPTTDFSITSTDEKSADNNLEY